MMSFLVLPGGKHQSINPGSCKCLIASGPYFANQRLRKAVVAERHFSDTTDRGLGDEVELTSLYLIAETDSAVMVRYTGKGLLILDVRVISRESFYSFNRYSTKPLVEHLSDGTTILFLGSLGGAEVNDG